jgi:signal recognition particle subunit SEC65
MSHARIEEVSDSDPSEGDISDVSDDFDEREILKQRAPASASQSIINPSSIPSTTNTTSSPPAPGQGQPFHTTQDESKYKDFQCIYPVYFDVNRSRAEGRRVGLELAVENPMAREIVNACARLRLETLFEPSKLHPKDWANPGRVKIKLKGGANKSIKNSEYSLSSLLRLSFRSIDVFGLWSGIWKLIFRQSIIFTPSSLHTSKQTPPLPQLHPSSVSLAFLPPTQRKNTPNQQFPKDGRWAIYCLTTALG